MRNLNRNCLCGGLMDRPRGTHFVDIDARRMDLRLETDTLAFADIRSFIANRNSTVQAMPLDPHPHRSGRIIERKKIGPEARIAWLIRGMRMKDLDLSHDPLHVDKLHVESIRMLENLPNGHNVKT